MSTIQDGQARRMGRPTVADEERKSATLRFRATEALRERIEQAANNSGLTLSEELERRLADSFKFELVLHTMFSDEQTKAFFVNLAALVHTVRKHSNEDGTLSDLAKWFEHDPTRAGLRAGIDVLVDHFIPEARKPNPSPSNPAEARQERFYAVELENMEEFGKEFTEMMMGKISENAADLNLDGSSEH
ncbi:hypothetical protein [Methylobacterium longum]|uniref:Relaxosome protein TraY n=1 Tax=Methylobacterium longum TaxID=767694 RepID=A0ABT8AKB3_9HYPH|nr:hypothetical protein [Methylobacterium longum]MDN3570255.1 hypothetical protein [Methylobacterium longum]